MRREEDYFGDRELVLVFMAKRLKEALALERVLDAAAMDYAVVPAPYTSGMLFLSHRIGAYFYVLPEDSERARTLLLEQGLKPYREPRAKI